MTTPAPDGKPAPAKGMAHFLRSCKYSANGFREGCREAAFRQELGFGAILLALAWLLPFPVFHSAILSAAWFGLFVTELLNTAIEAIVDLASPGYHELAKRSKDLASAAVTCAIAANALLWLGAAIALFVK